MSDCCGACGGQQTNDDVKKTEAEQPQASAEQSGEKQAQGAQTWQPEK